MCLAIPGRIVSLTPTANPLFKIGKVNFGGIVKEINLSLVPEAEVGNFVIVHAGFAINLLDEAYARQTLEDLERLHSVEGISGDKE